MIMLRFKGLIRWFFLYMAQHPKFKRTIVGFTKKTGIYAHLNVLYARLGSSVNPISGNLDSFTMYKEERLSDYAIVIYNHLTSKNHENIN